MDITSPALDYVAGIHRFTAANGVPFTAVILYGDDGQMLIAFYDRRWMRTTDFGQFTGASYYISTLTEDRYRHIKHGLNLHGGVTEWTVDADSMIDLYLWMENR